MLYFSKWKTLFILGFVALGILLASPNAIPTDTRENMPGFMQNTINLGLDLQGGAHMLLEVDVSSVLENELKNQREGIRQAFRDADRISSVVEVKDDIIVGSFKKAEEVERGMSVLNDIPQPIDPTSLNPAKTVKVERNGPNGFKVSITPENIEEIKDRTILSLIHI